MIFVTVGTHEQPFDRLIKELDRLVAEGKILENVFIQTGFSTYVPQHCSWKKFLSYDEMNDFIEKAELVITHGGPASFMAVLSKGKQPIVVPRMAKFGEHVNDHQLEFLLKINEEKDFVILNEDITELENNIKCYNSNNLAAVASNTSNFNNKLKMIIDNLIN